jgi:hypothetical protein
VFEIYDNFLEKNDFDLISGVFFSDQINWFFSKNIDEKIKENSFGHNFFCHMIYQDNQVCSDHFRILRPILEKLDVKSIIRIKANMYLNQGKYVKHRPHSDFSFQHKTALFYLNNNNGHTIIDDTKIESVENRVVLFDGSIKHSSTNCTDKNRRLNINFNYF